MITFVDDGQPIETKLNFGGPLHDQVLTYVTNRRKASEHAIGDDKLQMQNLAQLAKSTLLNFKSTEISFLYPEEGMQQAWQKVAAIIEARGGRIITGVGAHVEGANGRVEKVYAGDVIVPPEGAMPFTDVMLEQLFAEVWSRDVLSIRDRRLLLMGIIAEKGEPMTFAIQAKAALKNGELTPEELRETLLMIAQYAGYPRAAALVGIVEEKIAEVEQEKAGS